MVRREYLMRVLINRRQINRVVVDSHYEKKHQPPITDSLILELVKSLDGFIGEPEDTDEEGFEYYVHYPLLLNGKTYKLIWLLHPKESYVGIINAYRKD